MSSSFLNNIRNILMLCTIVILLAANYAFADFDTDPFYDRRGKLGAPTYDSITEHIDPFSGNMLIVHTDLHLPGKGGLDVTLNRSYNSLIYGRRDNSYPAFVGGYDKSPLGPGWSMHMGILRNPPAMSAVNYPLNMTWGNNPVFELSDGTKQIFYPAPSDNTKMVSKDFWILKTIQIVDYNNHGDWQITSPDGTVYLVSNNTAGYSTTNFTNVSMTNVAQVTSITNASQTATITVTYDKTNSATGIDTITDSLGRVISFTYNSTTQMLQSITTGTGADSRTISYEYKTVAPYNLLNKVILPVGNPWQYDYDTTDELSEITFPAGGKNKYTYKDQLFNVGGCKVSFRVMDYKETQSIRSVTGGKWTYSYNSGGASGDVTTVTAPDNVTETYTYYGWGNTGSNNLWKVGLPMNQVFNFNGTTTTEAFSWDKPTSALSNITISNITWGCNGFVISDSGVYPALMTTKSSNRDGKTYKTETPQVSDFNAYGDPLKIIETGDAIRTKTLTYCTNPLLNIVKGKVSSETIVSNTSNVFTGTSSSSWTYGTPSDCINVTNTDINGVTTDYEYYPKDDIYNQYGPNGGNLKKVTDANDHTMTYEWSNGKISKETNSLPAPFSIIREINIDGTVKNEKNGRGFKTSYEYDKNLRLTKITPPIISPSSNLTDIAYPTDNSTKKETRGEFVTTYYYDGFGRPTGSSNSKDVTTTIAYKAYGVKDYTDSNIGDKTEYDFFGRPTKVTDKDSYSETYDYDVVSNTTTTKVTDKKTKTYYLTYTAFGNPDEKYLMAVKDQNLKTTTYSRNILGNLTQTSQIMPTGNVTRSYVYGLYEDLALDLTKPAFLVSETNPETGTITYIRDNVGNMKQRTDASGTATYTYDEINRLKKISKNSEVIDFDYDKANNRTLLATSAAHIDYTYDGANRQETKIEIIAGKSYLTKYGYSGNDIINSITYPSGRIVNYGINTKNQVTSITQAGAGADFVDNVSYYTTELSGIHAGLPKDYTFSNNVKTTPTYNNRQLITDISAGTTGSKLTAHYEYDTRGNTSVFTSNVGSPQGFEYDDLSRLTTFTGAWGSGLFEYYDAGNRKTKNVGTNNSTTYNYNDGNSKNRLDSTTGSEPASYTYNGNGSLLAGSWGGTNYTFAYNAYDNLTSVSSGGITLASYGYDGDGMRITKTANGKTTVYHYDQSGQVISEDAGNNGLIADYVYLNGKLVAKIVSTPIITVTPPSDSFGSVAINISSPNHLVTIKNTGKAGLELGSIIISGADSAEFALTTDGCSGNILAPQASCIVQMKFSPTSAGSKSAILEIPSNDPITSVVNVTLNGIGIIPTLYVYKIGTGTGTISSLPSGIDCGGICSATFPTNTQVALTAIPDTNSKFSGWSGDCVGTDCNVTLDGLKSVAAVFDLNLPVVEFSATPTIGEGPYLVNFTSQLQEAVTWQWDFGDGTTSTENNPSHLYRLPGTYTVNLTAENAIGTSAVSKSNYITVNTCSQLPVRILRNPPVYYNLLQTAYSNAQNDETIQVQAITFTEEFDATLENTITIDGGYTCDYSTNPDMTLINGSASMSFGTTTMQNIAVQ